jgi:hypothetical protein
MGINELGEYGGGFLPSTLSLNELDKIVEGDISHSDSLSDHVDIDA